jgi:hypothetical protein
MRRSYIEPESDEAPYPFDFAPAYRASGWSQGIAWRAYGYESQPDEDTEWSGYEQPTGRILAHMVGDDRPETFDPEDLEPIAPGGYCVDCGQIGCTWHTEDIATVEA